jgi:hypothetical protein
MPVFVQIPENPNCPAVDGQIFQCRTAARRVTQVRVEHGDGEVWCEITGIDEAGDPCAATACLIEDSGEGECYLVIGGGWGLRLKRRAAAGGWAMDDQEQWGAAFLILGGDGSDLEFQD